MRTAKFELGVKNAGFHDEPRICGARVQPNCHAAGGRAGLA